MTLVQYKCCDIPSVTESLFFFQFYYNVVELFVFKFPSVRLYCPTLGLCLWGQSFSLSVSSHSTLLCMDGAVGRGLTKKKMIVQIRVALLLGLNRRTDNHDMYSL